MGWELRGKRKLEALGSSMKLGGLKGEGMDWNCMSTRCWLSKLKFILSLNAIAPVSTVFFFLSLPLSSSSIQLDSFFFLWKMYPAVFSCVLNYFSWSGKMRWYLLIYYDSYDKYSIITSLDCHIPTSFWNTQVFTSLQSNIEYNEL